jgi:hypothetical protein
MRPTKSWYFVLAVLLFISTATFFGVQLFLPSSASAADCSELGYYIGQACSQGCPTYALYCVNLNCEYYAGSDNECAATCMNTGWVETCLVNQCCY